jgi:hypothetical protein
MSCHGLRGVSCRGPQIRETMGLTCFQLGAVMGLHPVLAKMDGMGRQAVVYSYTSLPGLPLMESFLIPRGFA